MNGYKTQNPKTKALCTAVPLLSSGSSIHCGKCPCLAKQTLHHNHNSVPTGALPITYCQLCSNDPYT
jgi:hypothetical protein